MSTEQRFHEFGLAPSEAPVDTFWAGVVDAQRSALRKTLRGIGRVFLPGPLRNMAVSAERTFQFTVTTSDVLVITGLTAEPLRVAASDITAVIDVGVRRTMRTVVAGRLAGVEIDSPLLEPARFLVPESSLPYLQRLANPR